MLDTYQERIERSQSAIKVLEAKSMKASNLRTFVFFGAIGSLLIAYYAHPPAPIGYTLYAIGLLLIPTFIVLVLSHRKITEALDRANYLVQLNHDASARIARDWENYPVPPTPVAFKDHATARDLDIFGRASLFHFLNSAITPGGRERLADWLNNPAKPEVASARQPAVHELAPQLDWRQELHFAGRDLRDRDC